MSLVVLRSLLIAPDARLNLGLTGTLGRWEQKNWMRVIQSPDSDIPNELQVILSSSDHEMDDTMPFNPTPMIAHLLLPSPGLPSEMPLLSPKGSIITTPVFRANHIDEDTMLISKRLRCPQDDTKKSFDFMSELQKLTKASGSDRLSFIEQLENAFRMPAIVGLRYNFDLPLDHPPPVPKIPSLQVELGRANVGKR